MINLLFLLLGFGAGYWFSSLRPKSPAGDFPIEEKSEIRLENLKKIMEMFGQDKELANDEIQKALNVSDRTVTRYMDHLEKEGVIEQIGQTGRSVTYRLKK